MSKIFEAVKKTEQAQRLHNSVTVETKRRIGDTRTGNTRTGDTRTGNTKTGDTRTGSARTGNTHTGNTRTVPMGRRESERRKHGRSRLGFSAKVRPSDPCKDEHFEEVVPTTNASRGGLYFATRHEGYRAKMRLFVTFPYSDSPVSVSGEYLAQVVRVDRLRDYRLGVAVQLLGTMNLATSGKDSRAPRK
jgi:hypothetical protein